MPGYSVRSDHYLARDPDLVNVSFVGEVRGPALPPLTLPPLTPPPLTMKVLLPCDIQPPA